ncbi:MAG: redoxin domain-containing protein [Saprospiraceae bacterium]|nr:redoxin domain-containing protein [Saprospiraceae bacterium]
MDITAGEIQQITTDNGTSVLDLSYDGPVMLVFLRHFGCIFCREAMKDIAVKRKQIEELGNTIVLVHMESNELAEDYFKKYNLQGVRHVHDPDCDLYRRFGLTKGSLGQLFGLRTMLRGFSAGISMKQFGGAPFGDAFQMPGLFVFNQGKLVSAFIHEQVSDRPDYVKILEHCRIEDG